MTDLPLPKPEDDADRKLLADIREFGWHVIGIDADENGPSFAFSVGILYTLGHPEFLIMGLDHPISAALINDLGAEIRSGRRFRAGERCSEIVANYPIEFVEIENRYYREYLGYALWFYRSLSFPVLQCVWPDRAGVFPWESNYDSRYFESQRILGRRGASAT